MNDDKWEAPEVLVFVMAVGFMAAMLAAALVKAFMEFCT